MSFLQIARPRYASDGQGWHSKRMETCQRPCETDVSILPMSFATLLGSFPSVAMGYEPSDLPIFRGETRSDHRTEHARRRPETFARNLWYIRSTFPYHITGYYSPFPLELVYRIPYTMAALSLLEILIQPQNIAATLFCLVLLAVIRQYLTRPSGLPLPPGPPVDNVFLGNSIPTALYEPSYLHVFVIIWWRKSYD